MDRHRLSWKETLKNFKPLGEFYYHHRWAVAIGVLSLLTVDTIQLLIPLVIRKAIDSLTLRSATPRMLLTFSLMIIAMALCMALLRFVWRRLLFGLSRKIEEGLRNRLYTHLQTLSLSFYQRTKTGDIMAKMTNDMNAIRMATGMGLVSLTDGLVLGLASVGFMIYINPYLALLALIPAPFLIYLTRILTHRMSKGYEKVQAAFSDLTENARESFAGIRVIKAYCRERWVERKIEEGGKRYISENMALARTLGLFFPLMAIFTNLGLAVLIWMGGRFTILGKITAGDFVAFISYLNLLTWPMMAIGWVTNLIQRGSASMRRINLILDEVSEITDVQTSEDPLSIQGEIEFRGMSLAYPGQAKESIKDIRLRVVQGKTLALVGRVGSGKSTLLYTLPRLYDCPQKTLYLDGKDIRDIPLKILRKNIGFVTQENMVFSDTIRNNILFGRTGIPEELIVSALKKAQLYQEVLTMEKGMDTLLGERGITISGGQRQRLCIARAILCNPPILILDDALSMVDTRTEEGILREILDSRQGKTTIVVSHRLSTISRADLIAVLEEGRLVELGDHRTLMEQGKEYARLYEKQLLAKELEANS